MKTSKKKAFKIETFKVLVIIFIIVTMIFIVFMIKNRHNVGNDSKKVVEVHNYFNTSDLNNCDGFFNYSDKIIKSEDVSDEIKFCVSYQKANVELERLENAKKEAKKETCIFDGMVFRANDNSDICEIGRVDKKIINDNYLKIFGTEPKETTSFRSDNTHICYLKDDYYYCGLSETYTLVLETETNIYRVIRKATEKSGVLTIYDYFMKVNDNNCYKNYTSTLINSECNNKIKSTNKINYDFMKKYGTQYKHVYKKGKGNSYYWVSSEPYQQSAKKE